MLGASAAVLTMLAGTSARCQEPGVDLELDEYRIVGRDTRVFTIVGDRVSTVAYKDDLITIPDQQRGIETSQGLIGEDQRLWRPDERENRTGPYFKGGISAGSRTVADGWGTGSLDGGDRALTMRVDTRRAEENTRTNAAPVGDALDAAGYFGAAAGSRISAEVGFRGENDELFDENFRGRERELTRFIGAGTYRGGLGAAWDLFAKGAFEGGSFKDGELGADETETVVSAAGTLERDAFGGTLRAAGEGEWLSFGDADGTFFRGGAEEVLLLFGRAGITVGADIFVSSVKDGDTETRFYPRAKLDWPLARNVAFRAAFAPGIRRFSYAGLYALNGLVLPSVPLFFEDVPVDVRGELDWRFAEGSRLALSPFLRSSDQALVFTRSGDFFGVVGGAEVDESGVEIESSFDAGGRWGIDGSALARSASWNIDGGDVPYMPGFEADVRCWLMTFSRLRVTGRLAFYGDHRVDAATVDKAEGFMTIDCGVEREFLDMFELWFELRNITDAEGAWWTDDYLIPGIGLYAGISTLF